MMGILLGESESSERKLWGLKLSGNKFQYQGEEKIRGFDYLMTKGILVWEGAIEDYEEKVNAQMESFGGNYGV